MEVLFIFLMIFYMVAIPVGIVTYIFTGLALYKAAKLEGYNKKWIAWIPGINYYLLFKIGNNNPNYMWLSIINIPLIFLIDILGEFNPNYGFTLMLVMLLLTLAISIFTIIITIQSYLYISNKYNLSAVWFILGIFITPFGLVAYILWFNKLRKLENMKFDIA